MNILCNYEGASIKIIQNDIENNILYLSLKEENGQFSHYYNFIIENLGEKEGIIYIKNMQYSPYYSKDIKNIPYIKTNEWKRLEDFHVNEENELVMNVRPNTEQEISLVPRYVQKDLKQFIEKENNENIKLSYEPIDEIIIGDVKLPMVVFTARQHPGETLSSFFIEGVIQEILNSSKLLEKYCFVIYPIVNKDGVKNGNHRYTNGIDYNRSWNKKDAPNEIKYIKEQLKKYNIKFFIDVHNDEITSENYIRTSCRNLKNDRIAGIKVLQIPSKLRRFARALIKQKKLLNIFSKTANEYIFGKYHCNTFLVEITMKEDYKNVNKLGRRFIKELLGE